jgi:hypothetical protein
MRLTVLASLLALALVGCVVPGPAPKVDPIVDVAPPPVRPILTVSLFDGDPARDEKIPGATVRLGGLTVTTDGAGNAAIANLNAGAYEVCTEAAGFVRGCVMATVPGPDIALVLEHIVLPTPALTTSGPVFQQNGVDWRYKGLTAFGLLNRFAKGEDISGFLGDARGFNVLRIFLYTPKKEWGAAAWDQPPAEVVLAFLQRVGREGFYAELVLLTDDDPARVPPAAALIEQLSGKEKPTNLLIEIGNEPTTHKAIATAALRSAVQGSGFLYSSGDYEDSQRWFGSYLTAHTGRDSDWPRRAHDLLEYFIGGGPNAPSDPAHHVPIVADEPIRPDQATGDRERDFLAYFATSSLLGAGATYHFESGKTGARMSADEKAFAAIALRGLDAFPPSAPRGAYRRPVERSLRTYAVGNYMVRIRPETPDAPEPGWRALDAGGLLWAR